MNEMQQFLCGNAAGMPSYMSVDSEARRKKSAEKNETSKQWILIISFLESDRGWHTNESIAKGTGLTAEEIEKRLGTNRVLASSGTIERNLQHYSHNRKVVYYKLSEHWQQCARRYQELSRTLKQAGLL